MTPSIPYMTVALDHSLDLRYLQEYIAFNPIIQISSGQIFRVDVASPLHFQQLVPNFQEVKVGVHEPDVGPSPSGIHIVIDG